MPHIPDFFSQTQEPPQNNLPITNEEPSTWGFDFFAFMKIV